MSFDLSQMTPEQLAMTPSSLSPNGVYNLANPHNEGKSAIIATGAVLMSIMLVFAGIRYHVKFFVQRKMTPDDVTVLLAIIGAAWYYGTCVRAVTMGKYGCHLWDISIAHTMSNEFIIDSFFINIITAPVWALAKTSFFLMYLQLFNPLTWVRVSCYVGLFVSNGFYIAIFIASVYYQAPGAGQTWLQSVMNERYTNIRKMTLPIGAGNLILDLYIFAIPLIVTWNLHLSRSKRWGLVAVFGTGFIAVICSTLTIVFRQILSKKFDDYTYWMYPTLLLCLTEMTMGITCVCMPATAGFFNRSNGGQRIMSTLSQVFGIHSLRSKYRKSSYVADSKKSSFGSKTRSNDTLSKIVAKTYISIDRENSSTQNLNGVELENFSRV